MHSWQVVALPLKSQLCVSYSMALGDKIHVLGWPRCGLCCDQLKAQLIWKETFAYIHYMELDIPKRNSLDSDFDLGVD